MTCHHPDVFCCALLNSQPMGFYAPAQVVRDAQEHGVEIRPVCVNASRWDCTLEPGRAGRPALVVRLGLRLVKGMANEPAAALVAHRGDQPYEGLEEVWRRAGIPTSALEQLAEADAFRGVGLDRCQALWAVKALAVTVLPLFAAADAGRRLMPEIVELPAPLVPMMEDREVVEDYGSIGLSLRQHPVAFLREDLRDGRRISVPGIVLMRQKPGSAKGVIFITLEDETGVANLVLWLDRYAAQRRLVLSATMARCSERVKSSTSSLTVWRI